MTIKRACLTLVVLFAITNSSEVSAVSLPFSSSFGASGQCGEWIQTQGLSTSTVNCDGWTGYADSSCDASHAESITTSANNPSGGGGRGNRHWIGDILNQASGGIRLTVTRSRELWIRTYRRYQAGFRWSDLQDEKIMWFGWTSDANTAIPGWYKDRIRYWNQYQSSPSGNSVIQGNAGYGWDWLMSGKPAGGVNGNGATPSDGLWHSYEFHVKMNSAPGVYDGEEDIWLDGVQVLHATGVNFGGGSGWADILFNINQKYGGNGGCAYVDMDDVVISTTGYIGPTGGGGAPPPDTTAPTVPSNLSASAMSSSQINLSWTASTDAVGVLGYHIYRGASLIGNSTTNSYSDTGLSPSTQYSYSVSAYDASGNESGISATSTATTQSSQGGGGIVLLSDSFENSNFAARGWYDTTATSGSIDTTTAHSGSASFKCTINSGQSNCSTGDPRRFILGSGVEQVYISYWIKHSSNWVGSGRAYHPHMIYLLSDADGDYSGFYGTFLTTYVEENAHRLRVGIQDARYINTSYGTPPVDIVSTTENRALAGCNGPIPYYSDADTPDCYNSGGWLNMVFYSTPAIYNSDSAGPYYKGDWHHHEIYLQMNTIVGGIGQANGIMRMDHDGTTVINKSNMIYRTGSRPNLKWKQFAISPYIGDGSPATQTVWIDDLVLTEGVSQSPPPPPPVKTPMPPSGLQIQ